MIHLVGGVTDRRRHRRLRGATPYFARSRPEFADNSRRYYEHIREHDLTLTRALILLQRSCDVSGTFKHEVTRRVLDFLGRGDDR